MTRHAQSNSKISTTNLRREQERVHGRLGVDVAGCGRSKLKELEASHKQLTGDFDRFVKVTAQKRWGLGDTFRGLR